MKNKNLDKLQNEVEKKEEKKRKRKKPGMKVSGGSVKRLQRIIRGKV